MCTPEFFRVANDKWLTTQALERGKIPSIPSLTDREHFALAAEKLGVPMLFKPRKTWAQKGMQLVNDEETFLKLAHEYENNFMVQELVGTADEEYTVSVFGLGDSDAVYGAQP